MIDKKWIGHELAGSVLPVERTRLRFCAKAIGETNPVYTDEGAARDAGYADLPAPPTFLFAAELDSGAVDELLRLLQIPLARLLHGEQSFTYHHFDAGHGRGQMTPRGPPDAALSVHGVTLRFGGITALEDVSLAGRGVVLEGGRVVMEGRRGQWRANEDFQAFDLGRQAGGERRNVREIRHDRRRKRWLR